MSALLRGQSMIRVATLRALAQTACSTEEYVKYLGQLADAEKVLGPVTNDEAFEINKMALEKVLDYGEYHD